MILALFKASKKNQKRFYEGRKPTIDDVKIIVERIGKVIENEKGSLEEANFTQMREIARLVLQKAITGHSG